MSTAAATVVRRSAVTLRHHEGRLALAGLIALYLVAVALRDWYWPVFGVPGVEGLPFNDFRYWTTAWECVRDGRDVVPVNPCDPQSRLMDHPRIWLAPAFLGLGEDNTFVLGIGIALAFLLTVFAFIGEISTSDAVVYAAALCSPSVMLGVERANTDLIVFTVLAWGLILLNARGRLAVVVGHLLLFLAAVLKLYPVLGWGGLLRRRTRAALVGLGLLAVAFAVYLVATRDHIESIRSSLPRELAFSYGAPVLAEGSGLAALDGLGGHVLLVLVGCALGAGVAMIAYRKLDKRSDTTDSGTSDRELDLFLAGAGIYVGSFALTYNFNYRLVFLVLTLPLLLRWSKQRTPLVPWPRLGLTLLVVALWFGASLSFYPFGLGAEWERLVRDFPYDELINLSLFAYLFAALLVTLLARRSAPSFDRS